MNKRVIQLIFLVLVGLTIAWREWQFANKEAVKLNYSEEMVVSPWQYVQTTGTNNEIILVSGLLFLIVSLAFVVALILNIHPKLSSPNSV